MASLWALVTAVFFIQEFASTALVLVVVQHSGAQLWPIHIIWAGTTLLDMYIGYMLGTLLKNRFSKNRFMRRVEAWIGEATGALGKHGSNITIMLLGIINFPYLNTFIASWIDMPMRTAMVFTVIGNFVWYLLLWGTVLGLTSFIHDPSIILLILIMIGVLSHFAFRIEQNVQQRRAARSGADRK